MGLLPLSKNSISAIKKGTMKVEKRTLILLFMLVLGILGIAFLGVGIGLCIRGRKKRNTCTKPVTATVVDMQRESIGVGDSSASGEVRLKSWFPVYEYTVDGVKLRAKALIGTAQPERMVGETVELFVNPDRANEFYCPTEKRLWIQNVFIVVGVVCICLAGIMGAVL